MKSGPVWIAFLETGISKEKLKGAVGRRQADPGLCPETPQGILEDNAPKLLSTIKSEKVVFRGQKKGAARMRQSSASEKRSPTQEAHLGGEKISDRRCRDWLNMSQRTSLEG